MFKINLFPSEFTSKQVTLLNNSEFCVIAKKYSTGVDSITVKNSRGYVEVLPFQGQMIWDAVFDGHSLRMKNMFSEPQPCKLVEDTYGCFAFHSGLLSAGCPSPEDTHPLHGEFPCANMNQAWLEIDDNSVAITGFYEYVKGFGDHYKAEPKVVVKSGSTRFDIEMDIKNLSEYQEMPLQYMCHMNYAYVNNAVMSENIPLGSFKLRETIPAHVHPTPAWTKFNDEIKSGKIDTITLAGSEAYDPEIVFFADNLPQYGENMKFELKSPSGVTFCTEFSSSEFPVATRWILWNADQQVCAFVLPGTSRPEGRLAAINTGTLIYLKANESRHFKVTTGLL